MKFSVPSGEFHRVLSLIGAVIPTRSTVAILDNFLFELKKNELKVSGTDLDTSMTVTLNVQGSKDGKTLVPAKRLLETVRALPPTDIDFNADAESRRIVISTKSGEYRLTGEDLDAYPSLPNVEAGEHISLDDSAIRRLITKTSFAVSSDELRPAMMGVLFQFKSKEVRSIATDGHRLVRLVNAKLSSGKTERELVIPARALTLILKSINGQQSRLSFTPTHVMFTHGNMTLVSRLIEEKYPNYESVIPLDNDKKLVVNKNELLSSVRRTSLYSSSTNHQIRLSLKKNSLTVSAEDIDFGSDAKETLSCEYSSDPMDIGFNAAYIEGVLSQIDTDEVTMMLSSSTRASIISPSTQQEGEDLLMLVMPVRLNA